MEVLVKTLFELAATWGLRLVGVIVAILLAWIVAGWASRALRKTLEARGIEPTLTRFFANMLRYVILLGAGIGCLGVFGIQTTSFAAVLGAAGIAIGLAFKGTLSNFAAGMMLMLFRPFKVNDLIRIADKLGVVAEIDLFTTEITTLDNRKIIIPNDQVFGHPIENLTHHTTRRIDIPVGIAYDTNIAATRKVLEAMAPAIPGVLKDPPPQIFLADFGDSSINWQVRVWCNTKEYWDVHQATVEATKVALDDAKITIPFPQVDVHFDKDAPPPN